MSIQINDFVLEIGNHFYLRAFGYELFKAPGQQLIIDRY